MKVEGGHESPTPAQYRTFLIGFAVPLVTALFGVVLPCFAMTTGHIAGSEPYILIPTFFFCGWGQLDLTITAARDPSRASRAKRRIRGLLLVPMALIPLALLTSAIGVARVSATSTDLAWVGLVVALIGAAFLPLTARARRLPWLQG